MSRFFKQLWCWINGHGGITDLRYYSNRTATGVCKKCGAKVEM